MATTKTKTTRRPRPIRDAISTTFNVAGDIISATGSIASDLTAIAKNSTSVMAYESETDRLADMASAMADRVAAQKAFNEMEAELAKLL